nr:NUDIX domain-containing protein [Acholeplasmatales bacterium]
MKHIEVVCAIIVNDKNEIFVCKRGPGRALEGKWEFPGGKVEANETHEETIIREIK